MKAASICHVDRMNMKRPIGFFDSGVGGFSVLRRAMETVHRPMTYIGDTKRMPYGVRTPQEVEAFTIQCLHELEKQNPVAAVIACNTATVFALQHAKETFSFPVIGVIDPACRYAVQASRTKKIALLATRATVLSGSYQKALEDMDPSVEVISCETSDLVVAIEHGHFDDETAEKLIGQYLDQIASFPYDTLILGCTHLPLALPIFRKFFPEGSGVTLVDPAEPMLDEILRVVPKASTEEGSIEFLATGDVAAFQQVAERFLDLSGRQVNFKQLNVESMGGMK